MSRPISLALIILGSLIITSLIWLHFHLMERQHEALFAKAETIHQEVIAQKIRTLEFQHREVQEFFQDPIYERRRPALHIFATAEKKLEEYLSIAEQIEHKRGTYFISDSPLVAHADYAVQEVVNAAKQTFTEYREEFDFTEDRLQELLDDFDQAAQLQASYSTVTSLSGSSPADNLNRDLITISVLTRLSNILDLSQQNSCYRGCFVIEQFFPIVTSSTNYVEAGEEVELKMAVGSYSSALNVADVILIADGDSIRIGYDGVGDYMIRAKEPGIHTIETKCIITNPLTGEVRTGEGTYTYRAY